MSNEPCKRPVTWIIRCNVLDKIAEIARERQVSEDQVAQEVLGAGLFASIDEEANK